MFNLKAVYFYSIAVKITLVRFLKKIYFTTDYYNKTLKTRLPEQLYYYPNPFLLSSFVNKKDSEVCLMVEKRIISKQDELKEKKFFNKPSKKLTLSLQSSINKKSKIKYLD